MLTQCPSCQTTFRVTSEILRVANGQVRCGRCHTQFDALERLTVEEPGADVLSGRHLRPPAEEPVDDGEAIEVDEPAEQEDITLEGRRIEISGTYRVVNEDRPDDEPQLRQEIIEEWVEIEDVDDESDAGDQATGVADAQQAEEPVGIAGIEVEEAELPSGEPLTAAAPPTGRWRVAPTSARPAIPAFRERATEVDAGAEFDLLPASSPRARASKAWALLAAPLVLLLVVQIVHHYRAQLARHPRLGAPIMKTYSALNLQLTPDWNLHAYEVRQWGVVSDPSLPGTLRVRASVANRAPFAQPYPLLKLILEDRWGDQVRAREFEPAEYLDPATSPDRMLAPAQQANATIAIVDPGPDAEGFRFDVCLRGAKGTVCAGEVPE